MPKAIHKPTRASKKVKPFYGEPPPRPQLTPEADLPHAKPLAPAHFILREDGSIASTPPATDHGQPPRLVFCSDSPFVRLYQGNCLELLDAIYAKHPEGRYDMIFADPPYFLSNGGITCHAGKMVKVDKGDWDKSRGRL